MLPGFEIDAAVAFAADAELERAVHVAEFVDDADVVAAAGEDYLDITPKREQLARYGITVGDFQQVIASALGGATVTTQVYFPNENANKTDGFFDAAMLAKMGALLDLEARRTTLFG